MSVSITANMAILLRLSVGQMSFSNNYPNQNKEQFGLLNAKNHFPRYIQPICRPGFPDFKVYTVMHCVRDDCLQSCYCTQSIVATSAILTARKL